ncbi:MAG: hypothetical protein PHH06_00975 [Candidatus Gracilibacteria bacterium]|nr:hypothetical protein [Candidatus Gracilibacteria bacterium]
MKLLENGGRIKSASVGYNSINPSLTLDFQGRVKEIINGESNDINTGFFPKVGRSLRTSLNRQPLRPMISTHQGMPGNFYPFYASNSIDEILHYNYHSEHFEAILEPRYKGLVNEQQEVDFINYMAKKDLRKAYGVISGINQNDRAFEKGRIPFFICRPASTVNDVKLPSTIVPKIENEVNKTIGEICGLASYLEYLFQHGRCPDKTDIIGYLLQKDSLPDTVIPSYFGDSIIYFQADTFINLNG